MLALADYEKTLCPRCGLPRRICHDREAELRLHAEAEICWADAVQRKAADDLAKSGRSDGRPPYWQNSVTARLTY